MNRKVFGFILTVLMLGMFSLNIFAEDVVQTGREASTSLIQPSIETQADKKDAKQSSQTTGNTRQTSTILSSDHDVVKDPSNTSKDTSLTKAVSSTDLPKAGLSPVVTMTMVGIVGLAVVLYRKVVKYNI